MRGLPARHSRCSRKSASPVKLPTKPPASATSSEPAAMSQIARPDSKKPSANAGSHKSQAQRGGAGAAQRCRALHHVAQHGQVALEVIARAKWKTGGDQAVLELGALAHAD